MTEPLPLDESLAKLNAICPGFGDLGRAILKELLPAVKPPTQQERIRVHYTRWARAHRNKEAPS